MPTFYQRFNAIGLATLCSSSVTLCALEYELDAPNIYREQQVLYCTNGLRLFIKDPSFPYGEIELLANHLRWDEEQERVFVNGDITILNKTYTLRAHQLGYDVKTQSGEAWDVNILFKNNGRLIRVNAEHIEITPSKFVLKNISTDYGHGSMSSIRAGSITVRRAETPHEHRSGLAAKIDDIIMHHPRLKFGAVPVFWLPIAYRDYRLDYPWTKFEIGHETDRGAFLRARIGFDLPRLGDFSSTIKFRTDHYELSGRGNGIESEWSSPSLGKGSFYWFKMDPEKLVTDTTGGFVDFDDLAFDNIYEDMSGTVLDRRESRAWEFEHNASYTGGAMYLRFADLPNSITGSLNEDRFRADYQEIVMQESPQARQGLAAVWGSEYLQFAYDNALQPYEDSEIADRVHGVHIALTQTQLFEDIHASAELWTEQFHLENASLAGDPLSETWRIRGTATLSASRWYDLWGYEAQTDLSLLHYEDTTLLESDVDDAQAYTWSAEAGIKTRIVGVFTNNLKHTFMPYIGLEYITEAEGDTLPLFDIGDDKHLLDEDLQLIHIRFDNTLSKTGRHFRIYNDIILGTRDEDREFIDNTNTIVTGKDSLRSIENVVSGKLTDRVTINGEFDYNGVLRDWDEFDFRLKWEFHDRLTFRHDSTLKQNRSLAQDEWQHEPHLLIKSNRYDIDIATVHRDEGDGIDGYSIGFVRKMIDGTLGIRYELDKDVNGRTVDEKISFSLSLGSWGGL